MSEQSFLMDRATRFAIMIGLGVLMVVPLIFVGLVIDERATYQGDTLREVSQQWGGAQTVTAPILVIPVDREVTEEKKDGEDTITTTRTEAAEPLLVMPQFLKVSAGLRAELRSRGIYDVPVYSADLDLSFGFETKEVSRNLGKTESLRWDRARVELHLSNARGLRSAVALNAGDATLDLEPGSLLPRVSGVHAEVSPTMALDSLSMKFTLNGAQNVMIVPAGRQTDVAITGDWPHPSFTGAFLPNTREVTGEGFTAEWSIPHLALDVPQIVRGAVDFRSTGTNSFGVELYNPVDFYQKVSRAAQYGILFIALTFLTVFLTEGLAPLPVHPAQYVLIGVAQCVFFLLLLSFSEQLGFTPAYALAALATILLLTYYAAVSLRLGKRTSLLVSVLVLLYATLYFILQSTQYALLAGSILAFAAVALTMVLTRDEKWFGNRTAADDSGPVRPAAAGRTGPATDPAGTEKEMRSDG